MLKDAQLLFSVAFHEIIRQVSVHCLERGYLMGKVGTSLPWHPYRPSVRRPAVYLRACRPYGNPCAHCCNVRVCHLGLTLGPHTVGSISCRPRSHVALRWAQSYRMLDPTHCCWHLADLVVGDGAFSAHAAAASEEPSGPRKRAHAVCRGKVEHAGADQRSRARGRAAPHQRTKVSLSGHGRCHGTEAMRRMASADLLALHTDYRPRMHGSCSTIRMPHIPPRPERHGSWLWS